MILQKCLSAFYRKLRQRKFFLLLSVAVKNIFFVFCDFKKCPIDSGFEILILLGLPFRQIASLQIFGFGQIVSSSLHVRHRHRVVTNEVVRRGPRQVVVANHGLVVTGVHRLNPGLRVRIPGSSRGSVSGQVHRNHSVEILLGRWWASSRYRWW